MVTWIGMQKTSSTDELRWLSGCRPDMQALELAEVRGRLHDEEMAGQAQEARVTEAQSLTAQLKQQVRELHAQMVSMDR